jgi:hypothetical protein
VIDKMLEEIKEEKKHNKEVDLFKEYQPPPNIYSNVYQKDVIHKHEP